MVSFRAVRNEPRRVISLGVFPVTILKIAGPRIAHAHLPVGLWMAHAAMEKIASTANGNVGRLADRHKDAPWSQRIKRF
jgi:hypothetical protein